LSSFNAVQFGQTGIIQSRQANPSITIADNVYRANAGSTGYKAIATAASSMITQSSGQIDFYTNASASAGADVTLNKRVSIDSNGQTTFTGQDEESSGEAYNYNIILAPDTSLSIAAGKGTGILFQSEDSGSSGRHAANINSFRTASSASNTSNGLRFTVRPNGSDMIEAFRLRSDEAVFNENANAIDFRVETASDPNSFFVDSSINQIRMSGGHQFNSAPKAQTGGEFLHFNTGRIQVSSGATSNINLFERLSVDSSCAGTVYIACENSGENVNWSYILDFHFSNGTFTTTARATGDSQSTTTVSLSENGAHIMLSVVYGGGLGGNIEYNAGGHASLLQHT